MGSTFNFGSVASTLNTGSYNDGVVTTSGGYVSRGYSNSRNASSTNIARVSRDLAAGYSQNIAIIQQYLADGDVAQAMEVYEQMYDEAQQTAKNYGYTLTDSQVSSIVDNAYSRATGTSFTASVTEQSSSSFVDGLKKGVPLLGLLSKSESKADTLAELSGTKVSPAEKAKKVTGSVLSGAATGAAIGTCIPPFGLGVGTAVGAVIGGGIGLIQGLFD